MPLGIIGEVDGQFFGKPPLILILLSRDLRSRFISRWILDSITEEAESWGTPNGTFHPLGCLGALASHMHITFHPLGCLGVAQSLGWSCFFEKIFHFGVGFC